MDAEERILASFAAGVAQDLNFIDHTYIEKPKTAGKLNKLDPRELLGNAATPVRVVPVPIPKSAEDLIPMASGDKPLPIPMDISPLVPNTNTSMGLPTMELPPKQPPIQVPIQETNQLEMPFIKGNKVRVNAVESIADLVDLLVHRLDKIEKQLIIGNTLLEEVKQNTARRKYNKKNEDSTDA